MSLCSCLVNVGNDLIDVFVDSENACKSFDCGNNAYEQDQIEGYLADVDICNI